MTPAKKVDTIKSFETTKPTEGKDPKPEGVKKVKKAGEGKKDDTSTKVAGSKVNNKINERDLKDPKNKDC